MATFSAIYRYCDGFTASTVTVTLHTSTCPAYAPSYTNDPCTYKTYKQDIWFTLSKAVPVILPIKFRVEFSQQTDYGAISTGIQTWSFNLPAYTTIYYPNFGGNMDEGEFICHEERWCTFGSGTDGYYIPTAV